MNASAADHPTMRWALALILGALVIALALELAAILFRLLMGVPRWAHPLLALGPLILGSFWMMAGALRRARRARRKRLGIPHGDARA